MATLSIPSCRLGFIRLRPLIFFTVKLMLELSYHAETGSGHQYFSCPLIWPTVIISIYSNLFIHLNY